MTTSPSYEIVNYAVRTGKNIERKMIAEALQRLERLHPLSDYRYVGFGGIFFTDFLVMHRMLGLNDMVSIEEQVGNLDRIEFNRPLGSIKLEGGHSSAVLAKLPWTPRTILWLDYDTAIHSDHLADIEYIAANLAGDSVLLVSMNVHPPAISNEGSRVEWLRDRIGTSRMPIAVSNDAHLSRKRLPGITRGLVDAAIAKALSDRNRARVAADQLTYEQLFNFQYSDGADMATFGGILCPGSVTTRVNLFQGLPQINEGPDPLVLRVPVLTPKERFHLARQLPCAPGALQSPGVPPDDLQDFVDLHRHYPNYFDVPL